MPENGNEERHGEEPAHFTDERKVDPERGEVRDAEGHEEATAATDNAESEDALAQAEQILNEAGDQQEQPAAASDVEAELRNDLLRLQAEYVNYRKRVERDREAVRDLAVQSVLASLLPVLDDLDAARKHGDLEEGPFAAVSKKIDTILAGHGLSRIEDVGVAFDPTVHEALMQQPSSEVPEDHVAQVLRIGYQKGERIIRAAQVIVSTGE